MKIKWWTIIFVAFLFSSLALHQLIKLDASRQLSRFSPIIASNLWMLDDVSLKEYLKIMIESEGYSYAQVYDENDKLFITLESGTKRDGLGNFIEKFHSNMATRLSSKLFYDGQYIGRILVHKQRYSFEYLFALLIFFILLGVIGNLRIRAMEESKRITAHLLQAEKLASLGTLGAGVAHELNNPLTVITGNIGLIQRRMKNGQTDLTTLNESLNTISEQAKRMAKIIAHIREFSREDKSDSFESININEFVRDSLILLERDLLNHKIDLNVSYLEPDLKLLIMPNKVRTVIHNLVLNARDTMVDKMQSTNSEMCLSIRLSVVENKLQIEIQDTGNGIPQNVIAKIFDPFFTTKEVGKGTGLGLSTAKSVIEQHKGEMLVSSIEKVGTTFTILLPLS